MIKSDLHPMAPQASNGWSGNSIQLFITVI